MNYFTLFIAFLYLTMALSISWDTSKSPFPQGTMTRTFPKQTVTFILGYIPPLLTFPWISYVPFIAEFLVFIEMCRSSCHAELRFWILTVYVWQVLEQVSKFLVHPPNQYSFPVILLVSGLLLIIPKYVILLLKTEGTSKRIKIKQKH